MSFGSDVDRSWRVVRLARDLRVELAQWCRKALPQEACGTLLGAIEGESVRVDLATQARNRSADPTASFELDPGDLHAAYCKAVELGLSVVGIWHSHPRGPSQPSREDIQDAWEGWTSLIVVPEGAAHPALRAFRFSAGQAVQLELQIPPIPSRTTSTQFHRRV